MAGFLTQFYNDLSDDYKIRRTDSFLVQYLKQERLREGEKSQTGTAARLDAAYAQATDDAGRLAYLQEALSLLGKSNKTLLRREPDPAPDAPPEQIARNRLLAYAKSTGCPALREAARWDKRACRALLAHLKEHKAPPPGDALIRALHAELQDGLLQREAEDYLYNVQNGRKQSRDLLILEAYLNEHYNQYADGDGGETNSSLDVYYARSSAGTRQRVWTDEALEKSQQFFEALQKKKHQYVWIPVEIDPRTGAGVYFIGMGHLISVEIGPKDSGDHCRIASLCFRDFDPQISEDDDITLPLWTGTREELEDLCDYPNVKEALTWHRRMLEAESEQSPLNEFRDLNEDPPPECPPEYLCYFNVPAAQQPLDLNAARQAGRSSFAQEKTPLQKR